MTTIETMPPTRRSADPRSAPAEGQSAPNQMHGDADHAEPRPALVRRHVTEDQICVLTFDRPDSQANLFDRATLEALQSHLQAIANDSHLRGLILCSAKKSIFIAGADIQSLSQADRPDEIRSIIALGQRVFNQLAALSIPKVAAIHGACVGGGYEICLACDYRIASPAKETKIGLPEVKLGILPGWGGSTRLPRLIGLPPALDIILNGKTMAAKAALKRGLVDALAPKESLLEASQRALKKLGRGRSRRSLPLKFKITNTGLVAALIRRKLKGTLAAKTRGHYPAVTKALEVLTQGIAKSMEGSLLLEREAVVELAQTEACRNLIRVFFLQERAKKLGRPKDKTPVAKVERMAVIGAGVMGAGIAQWSSSRGIGVILRDIGVDQVAKGMATAAKLFAQGRKRHVFTAVEAQAGMDRIRPTASEVPLHRMDLVVEAAVEKMDLKKSIFQRLAEITSPQTILATNTSALSISELAREVPHPERVVGVHFFNPVHRMQLVEVVVGSQTSAEVVQRALQFVQQLGKLPVQVKDSPGFLVNRILMPYLVEAGHLFEQGADPELIDQAMLSFGMPMGPLRLIDEVGVDVAHHVAQTLGAAFPDRFLAPKILPAMMEAGFLGKKSGRGFYAYEGKAGKTAPNDRAFSFRQSRQASSLTLQELQSRMNLLMVNEAARCLEESVVEEPCDVDFGMIMGTGYAPFRGGPLRYADKIGVAQLVADMDALSQSNATHFAPCDLLQSMARDRKTFYQD